MSTSSSAEGQQGPEYLEQGSGAPLSQDPDRGSGRRKTLLAGGAVAGLALLGGGVWAAMSFLGQGPQPAEVLPASTLGYAAIDLDPSGGQKVEALRMLKKFPAVEDEVGLDIDDDIVERLFDEAELAELCPDLSYADDVRPWLGDRFAMAAMDIGGDEGPTIAAVLAVEDAATAEDGLSKLSECAGAGAGGFTVEGEWAVLAQTASIAEDVVEAGNKDPLVEDEEYQRWTEEVGDAGVLNLYAAPEAGQYYAETLGNMAGLVPGLPGQAMPESGTPDELLRMLEEFEGAAATLRFDDGALELEVAGDATVTQQALPVSDGGDDVLSTLPADTAAAVGVGFADGWLSKWMEQAGAGMGLDGMLWQLEAETGLSLPEDVETLTGDSAAVAIGPGIDLGALVNSSTPEGLPVGLKVQGDAEEIEAVLGKLRASLGPDAELILSRSEGDTVSISASEDYLTQLAEDGELGGGDTFQDVVREAEDASSILFVDFDAGDNWLVGLAGEDPMVAENLEPLAGLGVSGWVDDEVGHVVLRVTTD